MNSNPQNKLKEIINLLPSSTDHKNLADQLLSHFTQQPFEGVLPSAIASSICDALDIHEQQLAFLLLPLASCYSISSISSFKVGAVVKGESGNLYLGANMEFPVTAIQQTIHAEQSAIAHAWMRGEFGISDLTVSYTPCGHCRQFINELNCADQLSIHLPHKNNISLQTLLPKPFGPKDLGIQKTVFGTINNQFVLQTNDENVTSVLSALNKSYAPYSNNFCGISIQMDDGKIFIGSYLENAAFNPSLPALQVALNHLILSGYQFNAIKRVILIEHPTALSYKPMAENLLASISNVQLEYIVV